MQGCPVGCRAGLVDRAVNQGPWLQERVGGGVEVQTLESQKRSMSSKQRLVALRLARLGILYPNEDVFKLTTAMLLLASHQGPPETLQVTWHHAFATLQNNKKYSKGGEQGLSGKRPQGLPRQACRFRSRSAARW